MDNNKKQTLKFMKCREDAVLPTKAHKPDSGYDLTLTGIEKVLPSGVIMCRTGIKSKPPEGFYLDLLPRSSITKTGYILAHSVGVIDEPYIGELFVPLYKNNKDMPDIEFPIKLCQLVIRKRYDFDVEEVFSLEETDRGEGGFGSSDNKKV